MSRNTTIEQYALALLAEELAEASVEVARAQRFGLHTSNKEGLNQCSAISRELGDVHAAINFFHTRITKNMGETYQQYQKKTARLFDPNSKDLLGRPLVPLEEGE